MIKSTGSKEAETTSKKSRSDSSVRILESLRRVRRRKTRWAGAMMRQVKRYQSDLRDCKVKNLSVLRL